MRVALYARVSTWDKEQNPDTQLRQLWAWAEACGHTVVGEYVDQAGATDLRQRYAWREMWDQQRLWDTFAVTKIDRAWRSSVMMLADLGQLEARGKGFIATTQPIDTTAPTGRLLLQILGSVAEFERELLRERTREGMARARAEGKPIGKRGPDKSKRRSRASNDRQR